MRPKVVISVLVVAFGLLGIVAVLKGLTGKNTVDSSSQVAAATTNANSASSGAAPNTQAAQAPTGVVNNAPPSPELRAAIIAKEQERIGELMNEVDGSNNPVIIAALIEKVENPEAEVRKAALTALEQISDTNSITALQQAADQVTDPRAKVAILDAIDYINLPDALPTTPPPGWTNTPPANVPSNLRMNPKFMHTNNAYSQLQNNGAQ